MENSRTIRIFVSSTFTDFEQERNLLMRHVFLRLEELCRRNRFSFPIVDLRWGITQEDARDHRTVQICFDEIARCQEVSKRPNFLVLSGFRKRASDTRESFVVRNNTPHHITQATLTLRYTEADGGQVIAEQTVTLQLDLPPGGSQRVTVGSFDTQKRYHYAYGSKPRLKSTPFDVDLSLGLLP